ncbi:hypothetical protein ZOSMA_113G00500 [Zostera marina]|uniref:Jacalin-type lectin domain-containing protein n=1 Tax=Zostera marina TaxID=29655 RepID=A0A0K9Q4X2_ZOSMR|nr:hypothetical protein ZOSMA_113G00500 [Zostera marina]
MSSVLSSFSYYYTRIKSKIYKVDQVYGPFGVLKTGPIFDFNGHGSHITSMKIYHGALVEAIEVTFTNRDYSFTEKTGGNKCPNIREILLRDNEHITEVGGVYGKWNGNNGILRITFITNQGREFGPYGYTDGVVVTEEGYFQRNGGKLVGIFGTTSSIFHGMTSIGFYFQPE